MNKKSLKFENVLRPAQRLLMLAWLLSALVLSFDASGFTRVNKEVAEAVKVWEQKVSKPTYLAGEPEPNPMFYMGRAYQGAEGRVYPYPLYDKLTGKKEDKVYNMVYLENEYVKIGILPEIGGRIFSAVDKTNNYDFFYRQHVIKPALIGMLGAWISGGVEWNIPHHHRASSFNPVQYKIEENEDGSKTVWIGEMELRHRTRWVLGYTLKPGSSLLETSIRILNNTPVSNSILMFANAAVHTNEDYQILFPPSTQHVTYHSKREFTTWPVAKGAYAGSDFGDGVDVSWYKNHLLSSSMFAWNYDDDFVGGYDHGKRAGTLAVANHHVVPGKKFWTWGNGPGGRVWDKILTDEDGPYIELMVGGYSDNQPDYSWTQPFEVKSFEQYWYPIRDIGGVKKAAKEAAMNLEVNKDGTVFLGVYATSALKEATIRLMHGDKILFEEKTAVAPDKPFTKTINIPKGTQAADLRGVLSADGAEVIAYSPVVLQKEPMPEPVTPPSSPKEIKTNEELYLTGLRIEQFHNPGLEPEPYWEEALRRDPGDSRVNTVMGIKLLKKADYPKAEQYLRTVVERVSAQYTSPKDGEPYYYLGQALQRQGKLDEAYNALYKAIWSDAWKSAGYFALAQIAATRGDMATALDHINESLLSNGINTKALALKAALLRHSGKKEEAGKVLADINKIDPLDVRALAESWLIDNSNQEVVARLEAAFQNFPENGTEVALEYSSAGLWSDATAVLTQMVQKAPDRNKVSPLVYYYLGYFAEQLGQPKQALDYYKSAARMPSDYVFPFQHEAIGALKQAMKANPKDGFAPYYLGNLLFDWQPEEAMKLWEKSSQLNPSFSVVHRNLAISYSAQENMLGKAIEELEKAVALKDRHAIHFFELDQLYEAAGVSPAKRLAVLEKYHSVVNQRDDAVSREISLKINMGKYEDAIKLMQGRHFNVWEGGARFSIHDSWTDAHLLLGKKSLQQKRYKEALASFQKALEFPENLQTAKNSWSGRNAEVAYWIGVGYDALGEKANAERHWKESSADMADIGNDDVLPTTDRSVLLYYQALSLLKLGQHNKANAIFAGLVKSGKEALSEDAGVDFFAKFGQQQSEKSRQAMAHYIAALGYAGQSQKDNARQELALALKAKPDHLGAKVQLQELN